MVAVDDDGDVNVSRRRGRRKPDENEGRLGGANKIMTQQDVDGDLVVTRKAKQNKYVTNDEGSSQTTQSTQFGSIHPIRPMEPLDDLCDTMNTKIKRPHIPPKAIIYRDREGRIISQEEWLAQQQPKAGSKARRRQRGEVEQVLEWGSGLVQKKEKLEAESAEADLASKPFARYEISDEFDQELKNKAHWGDPMLAYTDSPTTSTRDGLYTNTASRQITAHPSNPVTGMRAPRCRFPAPPNRFHILPGYRWDGVVRGNNFEVKLIQARAETKINAETAYKWNVEDL